ncbi:undecaprenyl-phosphate glucose phosphotransferase [Methylobacterium sp. J-070]|uniref:undecaprenyl-phosphate glucose phosphotransferase n=1 Tax=Methylobacterium sp. J-070 TaxID=2836650 RepID=UPI001FBA6400|nr:undecaprenyl-phosphate glucose phosphotransferase [Methylobacterium sp. J-070]MCJ2053854.1 undecaprenyl-phosphate glucose phosphotransferase [Methylobacterium sp. J-070]
MASLQAEPTFAGSSLKGPALKGSGRGALPAEGLAKAVVQARVPRLRLLSKDMLVILVVIDLALVSGAALLGAIGYQFALAGQLRDTEIYVAVSLGLAALTVVTMILDGAYRVERQGDEGKLTRRAFFSFNSAFSVLVCFLFLTHFTDFYSRGSLFTQYAAGCGALLLGRVAAGWLIATAVRAGYLEAQRIGLIGTAQAIAAFMVNQPDRTALRFTAFELPDWAVCPSSVADENELHDIITRKISGLRKAAVEEVVILIPEQERDLINRLVRGCTHLPVGLNLVLDHELFDPQTIEVRRFGWKNAVKLCQPPLSALDQVAKRMFDITTAIAGLVALAPLMVLVAIAIKLDSQGPVFFRQNRHGYNQRPFRITKFRTMTTLDDGPVIRQATVNDTRITKVGAILRRTNLDELPQLFDVLRGDMSLVGPRPHALAHDWEFESKIPAYARRHNIKPGLTGWAQIHGLRGETDTDDKMRARVEHDLYYIDHWSLLLDIRIIITTMFSSRAYRNAR